MAPQNLEVADKLESLAGQLSSFAETLRTSHEPLGSSEGGRTEILKTISGITNTIKQPQDELMEGLVRYSEMAALNLFIQWKVFEMIPKDGSISYSEIAGNLSADINLISSSPTRCTYATQANPSPSSSPLLDARRNRALEAGWEGSGRTHVQIYYLRQCQPAQCDNETWVRTMAFEAAWRPKLTKRGRFDAHLPSFLAMPKYFEAYGLKEPVGRHHTPSHSQWGRRMRPCGR